MNEPKTLTDKLATPAYIRDYRPLPFWSWNDTLDSTRLLRQIEWMHSVGVGGFFMHARGGLLSEYLGENWMKCCDACCDKAAELDMDAYMYDENGWPSGFVGGKLLENEQNRDRYLTQSVGEYDENAFVSYEITKENLLRADKAEKGKRYLNVYCHTAVSTVDVLNPDVVEQFLNLTHRKYKERYGKNFDRKLKGFFTDEPQYFRWNTAYTPMIAEYFRTVYGEDVLDGLGLLFAEKQGYEAFRYKYWWGMRTLFLRNFAQKLYNFCDENNMRLTGHYVEESSLGGQMMCCAGAMPFYEFEHMPGIDWLGRGIVGEMPAKQVGSAAAQTGKNRILTESFGCCGWDVTPRELKKILDAQYLDGVNVLCHHLMPSSEYGQRKRDYPQHYTPLNPWIKRHFKAFNDHYTRLGALIGNSTEVVNVCVLHPITSAYIDFKHNNEAFGLQELDTQFHNETEMLAGMHIPHHYVDEELLVRMGSADNGKLVCGKCAYDYVLIPSVKTMAESTLALLRKFVATGGKLLFMGSTPTLLEGKPYDFSALQSNCTLDRVRAAQPYRIDNKQLRSSLRKLPEGDWIHVINSTDKEQSFTLAMPDVNSVRELDLDTLTFSSPLPLTRSLRAGQSALLFPCADAPAAKQPNKPLVSLSGTQRIAAVSENTYMIDSARFAKGDGNFGENKALTDIFMQLLTERYEGILQLRYEFESNITPAELTLYVEDMNTRSVEINGKTVHKKGELADEPMVWTFDAAPFVKVGKNEITVTLNYYQDESVYYALFGEGVTESLRNCMVYNTALESVYLSGDFGVFPTGLKKGQTDATVLCDGFVLDAKKTELRDFITDGYATFAGEITLESEIDCPESGCLLEIGGRWQTAEIEINGKRKTLLFDTAADISDMAHAGKNTVRVTLITSLRNLMGPHHYAPQDEPSDFVSPNTFDFAHNWKDGASPDFRASYALVRTKF